MKQKLPEVRNWVCIADHVLQSVSDTALHPYSASGILILKY